MSQAGDVGLGVRMALAATASAVAVAAVTILVGRALISEPRAEPQRRSSPLVLVSR